MCRLSTLAALLLGLTLWTSGAAETQYVTDKLILGVYGTSDGSGEQTRIVRSGAELEVIERAGRYAKIRTEEGDEGWVKSQYLVSDPPAVLRIQELEDELEALRQSSAEPAALRARNLELEERLEKQAARLETAGQRANTLQQELDLARDALAVARAETEAAEQRAQAAAAVVPDTPAPSTEVTPAAPAGTEGSSMAASLDLSGKRVNFYAQLALGGLALLLLGMFIGYRALDWYIRRQHGGFRVW